MTTQVHPARAWALSNRRIPRKNLKLGLTPGMELGMTPVKNLEAWSDLRDISPRPCFGILSQREKVQARSDD